MQTKLILFLKQHPLLYHFARSFYWKVFSLKAQILGTKTEERKWATRGLSKFPKSFAVNHSHRPFLLEKISALRPLSTILEVGCSYGPNLYLIAKRFPKTKLTGIDINPLFIQEGEEWLSKEGISNIKLLVGKADELNKFQDKSFDIVFTDALLIYVAPDKIKKVIQEMLRITRRALILVEWHYKDQNKDPQGLGVYHLGCWKRNYVNLLKQFAPENQIHITKIPKELWPAGEWGNMGYVIEAIL